MRFSAPLEQENVSTVRPPQPDAMPDDRPAIGAEPAAVDAEMPEAQPTRASSPRSTEIERRPSQRRRSLRDQHRRGSPAVKCPMWKAT
jgi:hypothetical protein